MSGIYRGPNGSATADALNIDGDKGDLTISNSGQDWEINPNVVDFSKMQNISTDVLLGRASVGSGDIEEIPCTQAGRDLLDDTDASSQRTTLGLGSVSTLNSINNDNWVGADLSVANGGTGVSTLTGLVKADGTNPFTGAVAGLDYLDPAAIGTTVQAYDANLQGFVNTFTLPTVDATNGFVLQTNGAGTLQLAAPGGIPDGDKGDITVSSGGTVWTLDTGAITTTKILDDSVTYAKIQNVSATDKILGRSSSGAGNIEEITCTSAGRALLDDVDVSAQRTTLGLGSLSLQGDGDKGDITVSGAGATWTIDGGAVTTAKLAFDGGGFGYRNKIIGGDFTTNPWQRGTTFAAIADGAYSADRWQFRNTSAGVVSVLKTADAPTASQANVYSTHCLHVDVTTVDTSIAAGDLAAVRHKVEGLNAAPFGFGQAGTRYVTLSFWHKHTKTGTHCVAVRNSAANRSYVAEYTQAVTNTWELATITIPVDTSGTWQYDTGIGLDVVFTMVAGSTYQTAANAWAAGDYWATSNQVNNLDNAANNFKIALVQLELGHTSTPFETRSVGAELSLCQRYCETTYVTLGGYSQTGVTNFYRYSFKVTKRAVPTLAYTPTSTANVVVFDVRNPTVDSMDVATLVSTSGGYIFATNVVASSEL